MAANQRVSSGAASPAQVTPSQAAGDREGGVTWRSVLIGTLAAVGVCTLVPYNDFVLSDTSLAAGYLPLAAVLFEFLLIVGINAPLHRWRPRSALSTRELAIIVLMLLVACSLPNWGLMKFFIPTPVAPFYLGGADPQFWQAFLALDLPMWLFPVENMEAGRSSTVTWWFYMGTPAGEQPPYGAWITPLLVWGIFIFAMLIALVSLARMVIEQWAGNERLPFPLVQVQAALLEQPEPGRALNNLLRSPVLWIGLGAVFAIHSLSALHTYQPDYFPEIPLGYDLTNIFADEPFVFLRSRVKAARLSFMVIGVTYFIRSKVAFSLFGIYLAVNLVDVQAGMMRAEMYSAAWADQHLGACVAFVAGIVWIGRRFWWQILRNAVGRGTSGRYRISFWAFMLGTMVMVAWLTAHGVQMWMAILIVLFILVTHLIVARVVAETGIPFYRTSISVSQVYTAMPTTLLSGRDVYFAGVFSILGPLTTRDGVMGFALHGMGITRAAGVGEQKKQGSLIVWTLLIGCLAAGAATLYCQYNYATPMTRDEVPQRNNFGAVHIPERDMGDALVGHHGGAFYPQRHNRALHVATGFTVTVLLEIASLRWTNWPLLPVGFVTSYGAFIQNVWFSIFLGWLVKMLLLKYGGARLYQSARPLFVGLIFGEALAAGIWLVINALLVMNGYDSQAVQILL